MERIIDNLSRQHRDLLRAATALFGWLDADKLVAAGGRGAHKAARELSGVLQVHLSMEDRSFYPSLMIHRDPELRALAKKFLDERAAIEASYATWRDRWAQPADIERAPQAFVEETRAILKTLWERMREEDDSFHPVIKARFESAD